MGTDIHESIQQIIETMKGFNNNNEIVDQRAKSLVITKLEEAQLWFSKVSKQASN